MSQHTDPSFDPPLRPPEPETAPLWRWLLAAALVLVIVIGGYQAYKWLVTDVERRRAVAEGPSLPPLRPPMAELGAPPAAPPVMPPAAATASGEGAAPAVTGQAIHKCVQDGQVTYSNQPCPDGIDGTGGSPLQAAGADANGVTGSAGDAVPPVLATRPVGLGLAGDPGQAGAVCGYLAAEIERLDFEFQQPLPPAVIDHISTQLAALRAQHGSAKCAPAAKAGDAKPAAARPRAPARVVEEKRGD